MGENIENHASDEEHASRTYNIKSSKNSVIRK